MQNKLYIIIIMVISWYVAQASDKSGRALLLKKGLGNTINKELKAIDNSNSHQIGQDFTRLSEKDQKFITIAMEIINSYRDNMPRNDNIKNFLFAVERFLPEKPSYYGNSYQNTKNMDASSKNIIQLLEPLQYALEHRINENSFSAADQAFKILLSQDGQRKFKEGRNIVADSLIIYKDKYSNNNSTTSSSYNNSSYNKPAAPQPEIKFSDDDLAILLIQMLHNPTAVNDLINANSSNNSYRQSSYNQYNNSSYNNNAAYIESERKKINEEHNKIIESFLSIIPKTTSFWQKLSNFQAKLKHEVEYESPLFKAIEIIMTFLTPSGNDVLLRKLGLLRGKEFVDAIVNPTYKKWQELMVTIKPQTPVLPWTESNKDTVQPEKKKGMLQEAKENIKDHIKEAEKNTVKKVTGEVNEKINDVVNDILGNIVGANKGASASNAAQNPLGELAGFFK